MGITLELWIVFKKCLMKALCATCFGVILMTEVVGEFHREVLDTHLVKIYQKPLTTLMVLRWYLVHINWLWKVTIGATIEMLLQSFRHLTTATDVETKRQLWS